MPFGATAKRLPLSLVNGGLRHAVAELQRGEGGEGGI